jgi:hypothetical protein
MPCIFFLPLKNALWLSLGPEGLQISCKVPSIKPQHLLVGHPATQIFSALCRILMGERRKLSQFILFWTLENKIFNTALNIRQIMLSDLPIKAS